MTSPCAPPTIHHNILARHVTRRIGAKELDRRAIFVGSRHAPERDQLRQAGDELVILAIVDAAGREGIDAAPGTIPIGRSEERRVGDGCVSPCRSRWSPSR